jgi:prevent-host-death family protein
MICMSKTDQTLRVPAGEFQRRVGEFADIALTRPVTITRNGRDRTVMISADEYARLKRRDREALRIEDFSDADLRAIATSDAPPEAAAFDEETK